MIIEEVFSLTIHPKTILRLTIFLVKFNKMKVYSQMLLLV